MEKIWEMLSDRDICAFLQETGKMDEDCLRIILVELLSRIKKLERVNFALQALLVQQSIVDEAVLHQTVRNAKEFMDAKDQEKAKLVDVMRQTGISLQEWVNFTRHGSFDRTAGRNDQG